MDFGNQSIALQEQINVLADAVQAGLLKAKAKPGEAASLLAKRHGRENHLGHQYASQQTLVLILNKTGVLQSEADKCYDEKFTSFMTPFIAQVSSTVINSTFIRRTARSLALVCWGRIDSSPQHCDSSSSKFCGTHRRGCRGCLSLFPNEFSDELDGYVFVTMRFL